MKNSKGRRITPATAGLAGLCLLGLAAALAQNFTITWWTIDGGGGTSTGGVYSVSGTIGQPDTGRMAGGRFALEGGYWGGVVAIQTEGAPRLSVTPTNGAVVIAWPAPSSGWVLDQTPTLDGASLPWSQVPLSQYQTNDTQVFITLQPPVGSGFYRLRKP
jgi:hypothetical protein